jgi:hypothetical protein
LIQTFAVRLALLFALLSAPVTTWAADAETPSFAAATEAFAQHDYQRALTLFQKLRADGSGPAIPYNIAVCLYRLGRFTEAETEFRGLAENYPAMRALAEYNRGLALLELRRSADARAAFELASGAADEKIAALAEAQLARLGGDASPAPRSRWSALFDVGMGHDDNVTLVDEVSIAAGSSASGFVEALGYATRGFGADGPWRVDLSGYSVRYADASGFDQDSFRAAGRYVGTPGRWRFDVGPYYERSTLGGDDFERSIGAGLRAETAVGARLRLIARLAFEDVEALETAFEHLDGSEARAGIAIEPRDGRGWHAAYDIESMDRAAANVSADRGKVTVGYTGRLVSTWQVGARVSHRASRYDRVLGPDERLLEMTLGATRDLARSWRFSAEYTHWDNDADLDQFSYTSNRVTLRLGRSLD